MKKRLKLRPINLFPFSVIPKKLTKTSALTCPPPPTRSSSYRFKYHDQPLSLPPTPQPLPPLPFMLVFTPSLLPPTSPTSSLAMTAATLPSHFISSFSHWRQSLYDSPLTPPIDGQHRKMQCDPQPTTLPPISYLDRHLPAMPPCTCLCSPVVGVSQLWHFTVTPPRLEIPTFQNYSSPSSPMLATPSHQPSLFPSDIHRPPSFRPSPVKLTIDDPPYLVDWLDFTRKRSAHSIAEKTCEMICYLWFSSPPSNSAASALQPNSASRPNRHISATNTLQLLATPTFVNFMQKLLETTQVSQSVIVLSLHYIYRLKERNRFTAGQPGSEFRIAVAGLMMANKFLDESVPLFHFSVSPSLK